MQNCSTGTYINLGLAFSRKHFVISVNSRFFSLHHALLDTSSMVAKGLCQRLQSKRSGNKWQHHRVSKSSEVQIHIFVVAILHVATVLVVAAIHGYKIHHRIKLNGPKHKHFIAKQSVVASFIPYHMSPFNSKLLLLLPSSRIHHLLTLYIVALHLSR